MNNFAATLHRRRLTKPFTSAAGNGSNKQTRLPVYLILTQPPSCFNAIAVPLSTTTHLLILLQLRPVVTKFRSLTKGRELLPSKKTWSQTWRVTADPDPVTQPQSNPTSNLNLSQPPSFPFLTAAGFWHKQQPLTTPQVKCHRYCYRTLYHTIPPPQHHSNAAQQASSLCRTHARHTSELNPEDPSIPFMSTTHQVLFSPLLLSTATLPTFPKRGLGSKQESCPSMLAPHAR